MVSLPWSLDWRAWAYEKGLDSALECRQLSRKAICLYSKRSRIAERPKWVEEDRLRPTVRGFY